MDTNHTKTRMRHEQNPGQQSLDEHNATHSHVHVSRLARRWRLCRCQTSLDGVWWGRGWCQLSSHYKRNLVPVTLATLCSDSRKSMTKGDSGSRTINPQAPSIGWFKSANQPIVVNQPITDNPWTPDTRVNFVHYKKVVMNEGLISPIRVNAHR